MSSHSQGNSSRAGGAEQKHSKMQQDCDHDNTEQIEEFRAAFELFDKDRSGAITADELQTVMASLGMTPTEQQIQELIHAHDFDKSGEIEFNEFCAMMLEHTRGDNKEEQLRTAFATFDTDGSGYISAEELKQLMTNLGEQLTPDEINEMIEAADQDGDGQINYQEFVCMVVGKS